MIKFHLVRIAGKVQWLKKGKALQTCKAFLEFRKQGKCIDLLFLSDQFDLMVMTIDLE